MRYSYRHGDGSAEIVSAELLDAAARSSTDVVETGAPVMVRMRVRFHSDIENPVFGFVIRNRHGVHVYGTNTEQQEVRLGQVRRGETVEVTFSFDCWLATDLFSLSFAVHSSAVYEEGIGYDWMDGVIFFRVTSAELIEGLVNLNASASARRINESAARTESRVRESAHHV